jgi:hypothetical protein
MFASTEVTVPVDQLIGSRSSRAGSLFGWWQRRNRRHRAQPGPAAHRALAAPS